MKNILFREELRQFVGRNVTNTHQLERFPSLKVAFTNAGCSLHGIHGYGWMSQFETRIEC